MKPITSIDTALLLYYSKPELGNDEIQQLFGVGISSGTATRYKATVRKYQIEHGIKTMSPDRVNTEAAYKVWGIDVAKLERNRAKLKKLGLAI